MRHSTPEVNRSRPPQVTEVNALDRRALGMGILVILILTLAVFADVLFGPGEKVLSKVGTDMWSQYIYWREFGFGQLRAGNLPLWNPHIYSGAPYMSGFQAALLYPPNFPYLILPVARAANVGIALHVFLAGVFMLLWARYHRLHIAACLLAAVLYMFCGQHFMHVYAGHLGGLCAIPWIPLLFLSIDGFFDRKSVGWLLLGCFAVSMQILAGDPQYVFFTAVASAIYCALRIVSTSKRGAVAGGLTAMCVGAAAITAVQLLPGLAGAEESIRGGGVVYQFAAMFSTPPENLVTCVAPGFFGDMRNFEYWGRCYLWEMCLFVGVVGLVMAFYGAVARGERPGESRRRWLWIAMTLVLLLLALGSRTPLFSALYHWAPGFNRFRGMSKFGIQATAFLIMLSALGFNWLIRQNVRHRRLGAIMLASAAVIGLAALVIYLSGKTAEPAQWWWKAIVSIQHTRESYYLEDGTRATAAFASAAAVHAAKALLFGAGTCVVLGVVLMFLRISGKTAFVILGLATVEMLIFALPARPTFDFSTTRNPDLQRFLASNPGDYRIIYQGRANSGMGLGFNDIWGYGPLAPRRYAEFMALSKSFPPDAAFEIFTLGGYSPLYKVLRLRYAVISDGQGDRVLSYDFMPHVLMVYKCQVLTGRNMIYIAMSKSDFDPAQTVILETPPDPKPDSSGALGTARVVEEGTDYLVIEAETTKPAILLVTDNYATDWRARGLADSVQSKYEVMPANYTLRAIPLAAGRHRIMMEYRPRLFVISKWISIVSTALYAFLLGLYLRSRHCASRSAKA